MSSQVSIDKIKEGDVVAVPVMNKFGQTLIPAGAEIKDFHFKLLKTWNIKLVSIKSGDENDDNTFSEEILSIARERFKKRCSWEPTNANEEDLFMLGILSTAKKIVNQK